MSRGLLRKVLPYIVRSPKLNPSSIPEDKRCTDLVRWGGFFFGLVDFPLWEVRIFSTILGIQQYEPRVQ
jgi:hypothetical protein